MSALWAVIRDLLGKAWRNRWVFSVPVATLLLPATMYALKLPEVYRSTAVVNVQPLVRENPGYSLPRGSTAMPEELMDTMRDRVLTRTNLAAAVPILAPEADPKDPEVIEALSMAFEYERMGGAAFGLSIE